MDIAFLKKDFKKTLLRKGVGYCIEPRKEFGANSTLIRAKSFGTTKRYKIRVTNLSIFNVDKATVVKELPIAIPLVDSDGEK